MAIFRHKRPCTPSKSDCFKLRQQELSPRTCVPALGWYAPLLWGIWTDMVPGKRDQRSYEFWKLQTQSDFKDKFRNKYTKTNSTQSAWKKEEVKNSATPNTKRDEQCRKEGGELKPSGSPLAIGSLWLFTHMWSLNSKCCSGTTTLDVFASVAVMREGIWWRQWVCSLLKWRSG